MDERLHDEPYLREVTKELETARLLLREVDRQARVGRPVSQTMAQQIYTFLYPHDKEPPSYKELANDEGLD